VSPCEIVGLRAEAGFHVVVLQNQSEIPCRAVIVATGARYRRLPLANLEQFEGAGIYYAATELEARICGGDPVLVVGGGNSAGQAAIYLAQRGSEVALAIRRADVSATMSRYLIDRIEADPHITLLTSTEVRACDGDGGEVTMERTATGERWTQPCSGLFCFIGAEPATAWLGGSVTLDEAGFILTDRSLPAAEAHDPLPFETSVPGVFAVGDVRSGSLKRVAAAVGEGSSAVRSVHDRLARLA
jgi:thioredoxin reductase (NADPH)